MITIYGIRKKKDVASFFCKFELIISICPAQFEDSEKLFFHAYFDFQERFCEYLNMNQTKSCMNTHTLTYSQTHKHKNIQKHKHTNTQKHKYTNTHTHKHTYSQTHILTNTKTHKHTKTQTAGTG